MIIQEIEPMPEALTSLFDKEIFDSIVGKLGVPAHILTGNTSYSFSRATTQGKIFRMDIEGQMPTLILSAMKKGHARFLRKLWRRNGKAAWAGAPRLPSSGVHRE